MFRMAQMRPEQSQVYMCFVTSSAFKNHLVDFVEMAAPFQAAGEDVRTGEAAVVRAGGQLAAVFVMAAGDC